MKVNGLVAIILYLNVGAQKTKLSFHINIYHLIPLAVVKFITIICINVRSSMDRLLIIGFDKEAYYYFYNIIRWA